MFAGVIRDLHDVQFEAQVALPDGVDAGDVRTRLRHRLHELRGLRTGVEEIFRAVTEVDVLTLKTLNMLHGGVEGGALQHLAEKMCVRVPQVSENYGDSCRRHVSSRYYKPKHIS